MTNEVEIKRQVREFYNQVGWQEVGDGLYQNARYEDLRPVAREYIHRCHQRVGRFLRPTGRFLLDAGSGPIQYPEYLEYSRGYQKRVCADLSIVALQEARKRIGEHGLFVVADIANLPFKPEAFDGIVSLHTIHHLPLSEHPRAYQELYRLLAPGSTAVVVNGWSHSPLMKRFDRLARWIERRNAARNESAAAPEAGYQPGDQPGDKPGNQPGNPQGTFVRKHDARFLREEVGRKLPIEIRVWRSAGVRFLRSFFHDRWGGRFWLRLLFWLEERFPRYFGENGQYPLIVLRKDAAWVNGRK